MRGRSASRDRARLKVAIDGFEVSEGADFAVDPATGVLTFVTAPAASRGYHRGI